MFLLVVSTAARLQNSQLYFFLMGFLLLICELEVLPPFSYLRLWLSSHMLPSEQLSPVWKQNENQLDIWDISITKTGLVYLM